MRYSSDRVSQTEYATSETSFSGALSLPESEISLFLEDMQTLAPAEEETGNFPLCEPGQEDEKGYCPLQERVEENGVAFSCKLQKYHMVNMPEAFLAMNPDADALWPGSLVQTRPLISGILSPIPVSGRKVASITMVIASGSQGQFSAQLSDPSLSQSTEAIRKILNDNVSIPTPAKFSYNMHRVYSTEQLNVALGLRLNTSFNLGLETDFKFNRSDKKNRVLVDFTQEYYTVAFSPENGHMGFFPDGTETSELSDYISDGNPPGYISSVTWGRKILLFFESDASYEDLEGALKARFNGYGFGVEAQLKVRHQEILNEASVRAIVLGGNAEDALDALNQQDEQGISMTNLTQLLVKGANFSKSNPGVPISYTVRHVLDSSKVQPILQTEYTARDCRMVADVINPATWGLFVTLERVEIEKENGFCELFGDTGEFRSCLKIRSGESDEVTTVFCNGEIRKAKAGEVLEYGQANHRALVGIVQKPGNSFSVEAKVSEVDGRHEGLIVEAALDYQLNQAYNWNNWEDEVRISGSRDGCRATMVWKMEWDTDFMEESF
ncbi:MAG: thiol-activated cytolysin family protein [Deltaproteobacteria bacterium]|nr:thiol-activated cytolysin family protein [Deltaproteobacteria bacterium]